MEIFSRKRILLCSLISVLFLMDSYAMAAIQVKTLETVSINPGTVTLVGNIVPDGESTKYYFEFGSTPQYGSRTELQALPGKLGAYYQKKWDIAIGTWESQFSMTYFGQGGSHNGFLRINAPTQSIDDNHEDIVGKVQLVNLTFTGPLRSKSVYLGGGDPDLRDAEVSLSLRGVNFEPNGTSLFFWVQSQSNIERLNGSGWQRANWVLTSAPLGDTLLDGQWHHVNFKLVNDPRRWCYAGNNSRQGLMATRYSYWPLDQSLTHANGDIFFVLTGINEERLPEGSIDFDELIIQYRNNSLIFPANGGKLIRAPQVLDEDPSVLTDGWRQGDDNIWKSGMNPGEPLEFVYYFVRPVEIKKVQIHQNADWPAKDIELLVSQDGEKYAPFVREQMPLPMKGHGNTYFLFKDNLSAQAKYLKVVIRSGHQKKHWGLGEIEVFGTGAEQETEEKENYVNADVGGLAAGRTYHYRLVTQSARGISYGEDKSFVAPYGESFFVKVFNFINLLLKNKITKAEDV